MNYYELKRKYVKLFSDAGIDESADIDWIIVEITGQKRSMLPFLKDFDDVQLKKIEDAMLKRLNHIPIGFIFGHTDFLGRDFYVNKDTLIPRIDTEILVEEVIKSIGEKKVSVLDIGTGSGIIAITIALETRSSVWAVDISENALAVAQNNANKLGADVKFLQSDLFENIGNEKFDYIVSNPPYIKTDDIKMLDLEVRDNEPILALDGGNDGLDFYRRIIASAKDYLSENGKLFFEIGYNQAEELKKLMQFDFMDIEVLKDYSGNDRVVFGTIRRNYD